jgi:pseudouridine kinase
VARNIAENLARLEVPTVLLTAVGDDVEGERVLIGCKDGGVDVSHVRREMGTHTATYLALLKPDGELHAAITDFEVIAYVDSGICREALFERTR